MTEATFQQIVTATPPGSWLVICGFGEPSLHTAFSRMLALLAERGDVHTSITTNGTLLDGAVLASLVATPPDVVTVSFNGASAPTYERIMRGARFAPTVERIRLLIERLRTHSRVEIAVTRTRLNAEEIPAIKAFWEAEGARVQLGDCHSRGGSLNDPGLYDSVPPETKHCWVFPHVNFFSWTGDLLACCHDLAGTTKLGNISDGWAALIERKRSILRADQLFDICGRCDDPLRSDLGTMVQRRKS
jgi:sulfatase maturation enzyme AslB (radical SAM superfamily)